MSKPFDFLVRRDDFSRTEVREAPGRDAIELDDGQALLEIDLFSVTANNVTYAAMGEAMNYWDFFPAEDGWGRVPAWGYADVVASRAEGVSEGQRVYGYLPMSSHLVVEPGDAGDAGFVDAAGHRAALPAVYNHYAFSRPGAGDAAKREPYVALFAPLFGTSFLLEDWLTDEGLLGARRAIISSASSKTALALAFLLKRNHPEEIELLGLTSARNAAFVAETGYYDKVAMYETLADLTRSVPCCYLDFSGSAELRRRIHTHLGEALVASTVIGAASWQELVPSEGDAELPGPEPGFFFAPTRVAKRNEDWGPAELRRRIGESQGEFTESSMEWMTIREATGTAGLESTWQRVLAGRADPSEGCIVSLG
jgi:hypothetical protein